jgi:Tfp pilus assembly protein PilN
MRLNINLASQKYENAHAFYVRYGTALGLLLVMTIFLGGLAWSDHSHSVQANRRIADLQQKIADLEREKIASEAILNRAENHDVREESRFWNDRIGQRSFSWTQLFTDLERVMPNRAYVVAVEPVTTADKRLKLKIVVGAETHDSANDLVKRMEGSARFRAASIKSESTQLASKTAPAVVQFDIEAYYTPLPSHAAAKEGKE